MTRKTGKIAVKARQLTRSAKLAKYKRELSNAGVSLSLPKPSKRAMKEKEEELKKLYQELFPKKAEEEKAKEDQPVEDEKQPEEQPEVVDEDDLDQQDETQ
jgi:hypothetical protein